MIQQFHFEYVPKRIKRQGLKEASVHCVHSRVIHNSQKVAIAQVSSGQEDGGANAIHKDTG